MKTYAPEGVWSTKVEGPMFDYEAYPTSRFGRPVQEESFLQQVRLHDEILETLGDDAVDQFDEHIEQATDGQTGVIKDASRYWTERYGREWSVAVTSVVVATLTTTDNDLQR